MKILCALLLMTLTSGVVLAGDWGTDYPAAVAQAKAQNKKVLLDFTGSDWCGYCKLLDKEVLTTDKFKAYADKNFVLVTIDFPRGITLPDALQKQNKDLGDRFSIQGFPTLVVIDPSSDKEITRTVGYDPGSGPDAVIAALSKS